MINNKQKITLVSFLAYFVMSGLLAPIGIISGPMSEFFHVPVTEITAGFSWLTMGILFGAIVALVIFDHMPLKTILLGLYTIILWALLLLPIIGSEEYIWPLLGLIGLCAGIGLAGAALTISRSYDDEKRASVLVLTDSSFSIAGVICSWIAIFLISKTFHWAAAYQFVAFIASTIVVLTVFSKFPNTMVQENVKEAAPWPISVWLCVGALFLYTLGQTSMLWWLPNYLETQLAAPRDQAGRVVSQFWSGLFLAQLFVAWFVIKAGLNKLVLVAAVTATVAGIPLWLVQDVDSLIILAMFWGFANLGLLKLILSLATQMIELPSARLISSLLLGASTGTAVSPWLTSKIVLLTSNHFVLQFSTLCFACLSILVFFALRLAPKK